MGPGITGAGAPWQQARGVQCTVGSASGPVERAMRGVNEIIEVGRQREVRASVHAQRVALWFAAIILVAVLS